jgi:hypothetical protein
MADGPSNNVISGAETSKALSSERDSCQETYVADADAVPGLPEIFYSAWVP